MLNYSFVTSCQNYFLQTWSNKGNVIILTLCVKNCCLFLFLNSRLSVTNSQDCPLSQRFGRNCFGIGHWEIWGLCQCIPRRRDQVMPCSNGKDWLWSIRYVLVKNCWRQHRLVSVGNFPLWLSRDLFSALIFAAKKNCEKSKINQFENQFVWDRTCR